MGTTLKIDIPKKTLEDLNRRLAATRWPDEIKDSGWDYGTNLAYIKELCNYWQNGFDWKKQQDYLNSFHHHKEGVDGTAVHFILEKGKGDRRIPILLSHGYPDSFVRFLKVIPLLTAADSDGFSFDVIVPSLPGYGFSDKPKEKGMNSKKIAWLFAKLMKQLGYEHFVAHGGDWGGSITEQLAINYPDQLVGIHTTDVPYTHIFSMPADSLSDAEKKYLEDGKKWQMTEGAYAMLQGTKPQSLAYAMNDSPAGLAAWIVEKFYRWSDNHGNLESSFSKDDLLLNIMIYWVTETTNSAFRIYYESMHTTPAKEAEKPKVPAAVAIFPKDIIPVPKEFAEKIFNVKQFTEMPSGGHFAAMEEPELLADDIRKFVKNI